LNVILLAKNYENYIAAYYQDDWVQAFRAVTSCFVYGPGYPNHDPGDTIDDVFAKSPFSKGNVDLVVCAPSWDNDSSKDSVDPQPAIDLSTLQDIPTFYFLNKEYKKLQQRFDYIRANQFDFVGSVLWDRLEQWEKELDVRFLHTPFGVNKKRFRDFGLPKIWDFGFTGSLHKAYSPLRTKVKEQLFRQDRMSQLSTHGVQRLLKGNPLKQEYSDYRIFWAEVGARNLFLRSLLPRGKKYARFLNMFKTFLNTPSAMGLINTRFYELMATKTLILCPESAHYGNLLTHGKNCIMFRPDLSDFSERLKQAVEDTETRTRIVEFNYHQVGNYTYERSVKNLLDQISGNAVNRTINV